LSFIATLSRTETHLHKCHLSIQQQYHRIPLGVGYGCISAFLSVVLSRADIDFAMGQSPLRVLRNI